MKKIQLSLQLYSIRDLTKTDFAAAVQDVAKIGYAGVELAGYGNLASAQEVRNALDKAKLVVVGSHVGLDSLENQIDKVFAEQTILGNRNIICPGVAEDRRKDAAGWKQVGASFTKIGAACRQHGFEFGYHNHNHEFQMFDGQSGFDILWQNSDAKNVKSQLDVFWAKYAGLDPLACMNKLGSRLLSLHLKDMQAGPEKRFAPVGSGILDFKAIIETGLKFGVKAFVVEQDSTTGMTSIEASRISLENLRKIGAV
jgi:sugar phosphate isomerase/epimerase